MMFMQVDFLELEGFIIVTNLFVVIANLTSLSVVTCSSFEL